MIFKGIKKISKLTKIIKNSENTLDFKIKSNFLLNLALSSQASLVQTETEDSKLIVSLTTYNKRIYDVHLTIESIGQQTIKPNKIILWLDEDEFSLASIPLILHKQIKRGLEVKFCPNLRSYKKLIPTLKLFPNENIITIDDDIIYPYDMLEQLHSEHQINPSYIIGHRARTITFNKEELAPYKKWKHQTLNNEASFNTILIGIGGILYPAGSLSEECLCVDKFMDLAPNADDIWFKAMSLLNNTKHKKVDDTRNFGERFLTIKNGQDIALCLSNRKNAENDIQLESVFKYYNLHEKLNIKKRN